MVSQITVLAVIAMAGVTMSAPQPCICPYIYSPVCASNGQVFPNMCELKCHNTMYDDNLQVVKRGQCVDVPQLNKESNSEDVCICTMEYMPVCGSDFKTYSNKCMLKCAAKKDQSLQVLHNGNCQDMPLQLNKDSTAENFNCVCTREYNPVCGSDLKTYSNKCVFECAAKKDKTLRMMYPSVCIIM